MPRASSSRTPRGTAVYDSSENQNAIGQRVLLPAVVERRCAGDVFHSAYQDDALVSYAAVPIMDHDSPNGCVYLMDYDAEQGNIIANLERTILQGSFVLLGAIILFSAFFATTSSRRMRKILTSMRLVREGEYSHKIQMRGSDEFATLATGIQQADRPAAGIRGTAAAVCVRCFA